MKQRKVYKQLLGILLLVVSSWRVEAQICIIPKPQFAVVHQDSLFLPAHAVIKGATDFPNATRYLQQLLLSNFGFTSTVSRVKEKPGTIQFKFDSQLEVEEYELEVLIDKVSIRANSEIGATHAVVSLFQQLAFGTKTAKAIGIQTFLVKDKPAYPWRGFMLDESRHFFGKEKVKSILDWMAFYKLNKFHWHLTDEQGWRIEILKYPFLTLTGGIGTFTEPLHTAQYYTQKDLLEIVAYASARQIAIIPEIDMPGHATAANRAYPILSAGGNEKHPDFTFHPARTSTYTFLTHVIKEVKSIFPSALIHLGGDEVAFGSDAWHTNSEIEALKVNMKLKTNKDVEDYFMQRMSDSLVAMDASLFVWDEMLSAGLQKQHTILMWWRHDKPEQLKSILKAGYQTILSPRLPLYFDFVQDDKDRYGRRWAKSFNSLEQVYQFDMTQYDTLTVSKNQILGVQANLWTETVTNTDRLDYLLFPRIAALAELGWTLPAHKNYDIFTSSLKKHINRYKEANIYYYDPFNKSNPEPIVIKKTVTNYMDNPKL